VKHSAVRFSWCKKESDPAFSTGVSLHSHTLHSLELIDFIDRVTARIPGLSALIRKEKTKYRKATGCDVVTR